MKRIRAKAKNWEKSDLQVFWGEIAPCDHTVQIYENDTVFLNTLEGFVRDGFVKDESVIIIATPDHLNALNQRLRSTGFDVENLIQSGQYSCISVNEAISNITVNGWPDEKSFTNYVSLLFAKAKKSNKRVRVFGEIVAVLWAEGKCGETVMLEKLWHELCKREQFCLYCAYPKSGFTQDAVKSIQKICKLHSTVVRGEGNASTEIYYRSA